MDQDEWLRTLRYAGKAQDKVSVDTLMLRYRPIAPKPSFGQSGDNNNNSYGMSKRTKRKYVRVSKNNKSTCRGKRSDVSDDREQTRVVTLQLLPEISDLSGENSSLDQDNLDPTVKTIIGEESQETNAWSMFSGGLTADIETWVTVEYVTSLGDVSLSSHVSDVEIFDNLGKDTCPAFVSDGLMNRVVWINEAYRRNVSGEESSSLPEVMVWLVVEETMTAMYCNYRNFTCRVRMQYTWRETKYTKTVPCDVWKMEFGGFAWRLDTTAALTLWL